MKWDQQMFGIYIRETNVVLKKKKNLTGEGDKKKNKDSDSDEGRDRDKTAKTQSLCAWTGFCPAHLLLVITQTWITHDKQASFDIYKISHRLFQLNGHKIEL